MIATAGVGPSEIHQLEVNAHRSGVECQFTQLAGHIPIVVAVNQRNHSSLTADAAHPAERETGGRGRKFSLQSPPAGQS